MTEEWTTAPISEKSGAPPQATGIRVIDCGDPRCKSAHIVLLTADDKGLAQATISKEMALNMLTVILRKGG
jgi:hypothetical protein